MLLVGGDGIPMDEFLYRSVSHWIGPCVRYVALEALREMRRAKKVSAYDPWRYAKINRMTNVMRPYLEAVA